MCSHMALRMLLNPQGFMCQSEDRGGNLDVVVGRSLSTSPQRL